MVGALVLPEVMVGITEASITRRPLDAEHAQPRVDHGVRIAGKAHFRRTDGVEDRRADVARGLGERRLVVAATCRARQRLDRLERCSAGCATMARATRIELAATRRSASAVR